MFQKILALALLLATAAHGWSQEPSAGGLLLDDPQYGSVPLLSSHPGIKATLPLRVSLEAYCPAVGNQGTIPSCVGWAAGYGALSIQRAIYNRCTDRGIITANAHSALFIFNQIKADCGLGAKLSDALALLREKGDCLARDFDATPDDCQRQPSPSQLQAARMFVLRDYQALFDVEANYTQKVQQVKQALAGQKPVIVGLSVRRNFYQLQQARYWWPDNGNTTPAGGHAMVVVGYDDQQGAFRLFNSWGPQWGDQGLIWIKYEHFAQYCKYAYILQLTGAPALPGAPVGPERTLAGRPLTQLQGTFSFNELKGYMGSQAQFNPDSVAFNGRSYRLLGPPRPLNQLFQLAVQTEQREEYLYVLSIDAQRKVSQHFPQPTGDARSRPGKESGLVLPHQASLIIPAPTRALKITQPGTDRLVVLYSSKPLHDLEGLGRQLAQYQGDFTNYLLQTLGRHAVPPSEIRYHPQRMQFAASTAGEGYIVPLVLEVEAR